MEFMKGVFMNTLSNNEVSHFPSNVFVKKPIKYNKRKRIIRPISVMINCGRKLS